MNVPFTSSRAKILLALGVLAAAAALVAAMRWRAAPPPVATAEITRGDYLDIVDIRGEIRPRRSVVINAPMQAGDLQILTLAANGSTVKAGDSVLQFDGSTLQRTIQERQSELRQALDELDQAKAEARITNWEGHHGAPAFPLRRRSREIGSGDNRGRDCLESRCR